MKSAAIRRAREADRQRLGALWLGLLAEQAALDPRFGAADDALERWQNDFPYWLHDDGRRLFVAELAGDLAGFVSAHRWAPPPVYAEADEVYIDELYVTPSARGQGLGGRLVEAVRAWAETLGAERLRVGVLAANAAGRAFWERQQARPFAVTFTIELQDRAAPAQEKKRGRLGF